VRLPSIHASFVCSVVPSFHAARSPGLTRSAVRTQNRCCLAYCCCCCCLMKHPNGKKTSGTVHSAPPRVRAYMHAWQQHCSSARSAAQQQRRAGRQADRQGKTIQANARRQLCVHSFDRLNHHDDRERRCSRSAFFSFEAYMYVGVGKAAYLQSTSSMESISKCRNAYLHADWRRYHTRSCSLSGV
jgi:hypothetical protein